MRFSEAQMISAILARSCCAAKGFCRNGPIPASHRSSRIHLCLLRALHLASASGRRTGRVSVGKSGGTGKSVERLASHCSARTRIV